MLLKTNRQLEFILQVIGSPSQPYEPKVHILLETSRYLVKTGDTNSELEQAFKLRHEVFFKEGMNRTLAMGLDTDDFDIDSDHLLIIERAHNRVVGNYRVRCSRFTDRFYSESEFELGEFMKKVDGIKVEIGRACVHPDHRRGMVMHLLWRGLTEYLKATDARYLFGCTSIDANPPENVQHIWDYLVSKDLVVNDLGVTPKHPFSLNPAPPVGTDVAEPELPSLFASYLKSGCKVLGPPAFDPEFACADFLTLLDMKNLSAERSRRYNIGGDEGSTS
jgi:putative hemolysin